MTDPVIIDSSQFSVADPLSQSSPQERMRVELLPDKKLGSLNLEVIEGTHFSFAKAHAHFLHNVLLKSHSTGKKGFALALVSSGKSVAYLDNQIVSVTGGKGSFNYNPCVNEEHTFFKDVTTEINFFDIDFDYVERLLNEYESAEYELNQLRNSVTRNSFINVPVTISPIHQRIVSDIYNCPLQGALGKLMLEGSLQQLLALQFSMMTTRQEKSCSISKRDREIMHDVREYLVQNFHKDHSILDLSRRFAINQTKLKQYFKTMFSVPVIEYLFNLKMDHARSMLFDKGMYVGEVSRFVGYKNPNHFATAFKRRFGINPSKLKGKN